MADAIKSADPKALVTVGAWREWTITNEGSDGISQNYYSDECLVKAGGLATGTIDIVQVHAYAQSGSYREAAPFSVPRAYYVDIAKPFIIGEFASVKCYVEGTGTGCSVEEHYQWGMAQGFILTDFLI